MLDRETNRPNYFADVMRRLTQEYPTTAADQIIEEAEKLPPTVENTEEMSKVAQYIHRVRDFLKQAKAERVAEKEVYLRSGDAVDAHFGGMIDRVNVLYTSLNARVDNYKRRQLEEERARREELARKAKEAAAKAEAERLQAERAKRDAELAASRARRRDTVASRQEEAAKAAEQAAVASADAALTKTAATQAEVYARLKPADIVGERFTARGGGGKVTMRMAPFVTVEDRSKVDYQRLGPYFTDEEVDRAARKWAKASNYAEEMPGVIAELRETTVVK
jgi:multidrug resistance efflux pump